MQAPQPQNEAARLNALCRYQILDTPPEAALDNLTRLAAHYCQTPIALISLVDTTRQWFKSKVGLDVCETPREVFFCTHAIVQPDLLIVRDACQDARFANSPLVTAEPKIRFYAGVPLLTPTGHAIGTLCVIDYVPRELSAEQVEILKVLAQQVITHLELQRNLEEIQQSQVSLQQAHNQLENQIQPGTSELAFANQALKTEITLVKHLEAHKQANEVLLLTQRRLQHLVSAGPAVIYSSKPDGDYGITFISENITTQLGYQAQEFLDDSQFWMKRIHPEDTARVLTEFSELFNQRSQTSEYRFLHQDGTYHWIQDDLRLVQDEAGQALEILGCWQDITSRKQAELELCQRDKLLRSVAEATHQLLTQIDYRGAITKALAILGKAAAVDRVYIYENHPHPVTGELAMSMRFEWVGQSIVPSIHQPHWQNQPYAAGLSRWYDTLVTGNPIQGVTEEFPEAVQQILNQDRILSILLVPILVDDHFWGYIGFDDCHCQRRWSQSEESILVAMAASFGGAIKRQQAEAQLLHNALHDPLTNLPNRALFMDRLERAVARSQRRQEYLFAVLFLDLDRFKVINDSLGHRVGDQLLKAIALRLQHCLRPDDTIARIGGDEFAILLEDIQDVSAATYVAQRIHDTLNSPLVLNGTSRDFPSLLCKKMEVKEQGAVEVFTTASIGIALSVADTGAKNSQDLLRDADVAMYRAKTLGKARHEVFDTAMHQRAVTQLELEMDLRHALERQEFILHYQPIVVLETGKIIGFEALVRWQHPIRGLVSPAEFIPLTEETGLIIPLGQWVLREACRQLQAWQADNLASLSISVNVSSKQFQPELVAQITQILQETQLSAAHLQAGHLKLEITENVIMEKTEFVTAILSQLQALGIELCMDDFGTGYSSLSYLHRFPVSVLKIDRSFVSTMDDLPSKPSFTSLTNPSIKSGAVPIVATIIKLAHTLEMDVIAEGIETVEQLTQLKALGCKYGQGYLFSRPVDGKTATTLLK